MFALSLAFAGAQGALAKTEPAVTVTSIPIEALFEQYEGGGRLETLPESIEFGVTSGENGEFSTQSFPTMADGQTALTRDEIISGSQWLYSAFGNTDPESIFYTVSCQTLVAQFIDDGWTTREIGERDISLGFDAESEASYIFNDGGGWRGFSTHTVAYGSTIYEAATVDTESFPYI